MLILLIVVRVINQSKKIFELVMVAKDFVWYFNANLSTQISQNWRFDRYEVQNVVSLQWIDIER